MTELFLMVYRSPITQRITGEVFEDRKTADMMAVAIASTHNTQVTVSTLEVDCP